MSAISVCNSGSQRSPCARTDVRLSDSSLSNTDPHCVRGHPHRPLVVVLLLRPGLNDKLHGSVLGVYESQQGDVSVDGVEFAQIQRVGVL